MNDYFGQQVFGGRWPLVKKAAANIALDAINSPFLFQVRNLAQISASDMDPVLIRILGPNEAAGVETLGATCWKTLKGCLGKTATIIAPADSFAWGPMMYPVDTIRNRIEQEKLRGQTAGPAAVTAFFSILAEVPQPAPEQFTENWNIYNDGTFAKSAILPKRGDFVEVLDVSEVWLKKRQQMIDYLKVEGLWKNVEAAARNRAGAVASASAAQAEEGKSEYYRGVSLDYYPMDAAAISTEQVVVSEQEKAAAAKSEETSVTDFSKILLPAAAAAALFFLS